MQLSLSSIQGLTRAPAKSENLMLRWRKTKKCKRLIQKVQCRLKVLKNKRFSMARQLTEDVAQLIKTGHKEMAIDRAGQLFKDESLMDVYGLLDRFCQVILMHLPNIRRGRVCPRDFEEAVSSLVFASERCWDLPELLDIRRKLFGELYRDSFIKGALELCPGNLVNQEIRDKLCVKSVPYDVKLKLVDEISRDYVCIQPEILALGFTSDQLQTEVECSVEQYPCHDHEPDDPDIVAEKQPECAAEQEETCSDTDAVVYSFFTYLSYELMMAMVKQMEAGPVSESESDSSNSGDHQDDWHPKYVHPKLPDYDHVAAEFSARKKEYMARIEAGPISESETDSSSSGSGRDDQLDLLKTYSRAMSVPPPEPPKEEIPRSNSWPSERSKYVHPKLPEYDDIVTEFSARKRECMAQCRGRITAAAKNEPVNIDYRVCMC